MTDFLHADRTNCGFVVAVSLCASAMWSVCAGDPPQGKTVFWDDAAKTIRISYENTSGALGADFWITNRVYDASTLERIEPTNMVGKTVERFVVDITNAMLRAWFRCTNAADFESAAPVFDIVNGTLSVWNTDQQLRWSYCMNYNRPATVFRVHENATMSFLNSLTDGTCNYLYAGTGAVVLRGGLIVQPFLTTSGSGTVFEGRDTVQNGNALHMMGVFRAEASAKKSVISARRVTLDTFNSGYPCVFDVEEGAVLELDAEIIDNFRGGKTSPSGFVKRGTGRLVLKRPNAMTGAVSVEEGTLEVAEGASLSNIALLEVYEDARLEFGPGVPPVRAERVNVPAAVRKAVVRVDAARVWGNGAGSSWDYNSLFNLGTSGGRFTRDGSMNALTFVSGAFRGAEWPSFRLNWVDYTLTGFSNPSRSLTLLYSMRHLTTGSRDEWRGVYSIYNGVAAAAGQSWNADNDVATFRLEIPAKNAEETGYDARYVQYRGSWGDTGLLNSRNRPYDEAYVDRLVLSNLTAAAQSFVWEQHFTNAIQVKSSSLAYAGALNHDTFRLGCRPRDKAACAYQILGELMMFCGNVLSPAELADVTTYLKTKWLGKHVPNATDGTDLETAFDVAAGDVAVAKGRSARAVKRGAGTLELDSVREAADVLSVESGTVAFVSGGTPPKVQVWADIADTDALVTNASGRILSIRNKGALGGVFGQTSKDAWNYGVLMRSGTENPHTVMRCQYCTYDFLDDRMMPSDKDTLTSIVVFRAQSTSSWIDMFSLTPGEDVMKDASKAFEPRFYFESAAPFYAVYRNESGESVGNTALGAVKSHSLADLTNRFSILGVEMPPEEQVVYFAETELDGGTNKLTTLTTRASCNRRFGGVRLGGRVNQRVTTQSWWDGDIAEVLVFNASLNDAERAAVMDYLRAKWYRGESVAAPGVLVGTPASPRATGGSLALADGVTVRIDGEAVVVDSLTVPSGAEILVDPGEPDKDLDDGRDLLVFDGGAVAGTFVLPPALRSTWRIKVQDGAVRLVFRSGFSFILR